jgi:hypothetical protein
VDYDGRKLQNLTGRELQELTELCESYSAVFRAEEAGKIKLQPNEFKRYKN